MITYIFFHNYIRKKMFLMTLSNDDGGDYDDDAYFLITFNDEKLS